MKICVFALFIVLAIASRDHRRRSTSDTDIKVKDTNDYNNDVYIPNPNSIVSAESGAEVLQILVNDDNQQTPYAILFHSGETDSKSKELVNEYEMELRQQVLGMDQEFKYFSIDASKKNYEDLIQAVGIDVNELKDSPSVLVIKGGKGWWVHGPNTIKVISEYVGEKL